MKNAELTEADLEQAAWFALRMRKGIRSPSLWRDVIKGAEALLELAGATEKPKGDVALLAVAYLGARRCARQLPPDAPERIECEQLLDHLASMIA